MNVLETEWWTVALPPEWWAEAQGDTIIIGDRDEVGCIEISTLHREEGNFEESDLRGMTVDLGGEESSWEAVTVGDFHGLHSAHQEEGIALREWCLARGRLALFITYSCELEHRGMDDAAVDEILDTLMVA